MFVCGRVPSSLSTSALARLFFVLCVFLVFCALVSASGVYLPSFHVKTERGTVIQTGANSGREYWVKSLVSLLLVRFLRSFTDLLRSALSAPLLTR